MKNASCLIRNYRAGDLNKLARLYIERSKESGRPTTPQEIAEILKRPGFVPEKDLILILAGDDIIGYAHLTSERDIGRLFISSWIDPAFRRKGLATEMLNSVLVRARELGTTMISTSVPQENRTARIVLPKLGFRFVRRYLDFGITSEAIPKFKFEEFCHECHILHHGEESAVMKLQNRAFSGHWRYNPYDLETFVYDINLNNRSSEDIVVYYDDNVIAGYCWTELMQLTNMHGKELRGIINMLGVDEQHRHKGIGRKVLTAGLIHLKQKGASFISLQVDSSNAAARELYSSVGFREYGSALWYEREVS